MSLRDTYLNICHKAGVNPNAEVHNYYVFVNSKRTKFKLLIGDKYLVYHDNKDKKFPLTAIQYLPSAFVGKKFDFSKALEKTVKEQLGIK